MTAAAILAGIGAAIAIFLFVVGATIWPDEFDRKYRFATEPDRVRFLESKATQAWKFGATIFAVFSAPLILRLFVSAVLT